MSFSVKLFSSLLLLGSLCFLGACSLRPDGQKSTNAPASASQGAKQTEQSVDTKIQATEFPYPGEFKLVTRKTDKGLEEVWQARGDLGEPGGRLTLSAFGAGPKTFNVWAAADVESHGIGLLMYEPLVTWDAWTGKTYPRLAKSFSVSPDKKQYTFTLRKGLKWSDGKPLNADDVVFTFEQIIGRGLGNSSTRDVLTVEDKFPQIKKIDDLSVQFTTAKPFAPFLHNLNSASIAPKHILEPWTKRKVSDFHQLWDINCDTKTIVCSGPFKLSRYVPGQRVELERNPHYSFVDKQGRTLPYLDRFILAIVPDQTTQILKFYGGEVDLLDIRSVRGFDAATMKQRERTGGYKMYTLGPDDGTFFMMFNLCRRLDKDKKPYVNPIKQKWFNNTYFRQAVSHAVDRRRIVDNVLRGVGIPLYTSQSPASLFFNKNLKPFPQDLKFAMQLLEKGGFKKNSEGKLVDADGHKVEFSLLTNSGNTQRDGACVMIKNDLEKLGMKVNYQPIEFNALINKTENSLDWEAMVMGLTGDKLEPYEGANVWKSDGRLHMFDQRLPNKDGKVVVTDARDWEKEIDRLYDASALTVDFNIRKKLLDRAQEILFEQQPFIYIYSALDITACRDTVGNYRPTPLGIYYTPKGSLHNIEEIYKRREAN